MPESTRYSAASVEKFALKLMWLPAQKKRYVLCHVPLNIIAALRQFLLSQPVWYYFPLERDCIEKPCFVRAKEPLKS